MGVPSQHDRQHALDALRGLAMVLVVFLHGLLSFLHTPLDFWPVHDTSTSEFMDLAALLPRGFRLPIMFLLAGFFGHLLYVREGALRFGLNRLKRIGVPLLVGAPLVTLATAGVAAATSGGTRDEGNWLPQRWGDFVEWLRPGHLWFLYYVFGLYLVAVGSEWLFSRSAIHPTAERMANLGRALLVGFWKPFLLAVPSLALAAQMKGWITVDTPLTFGPMPTVFVYYGLFFAVGWALHRFQVNPGELQRFGATYLWLGVGLMVTWPIQLLRLLEQSSRVGQWLWMAQFSLHSWFMVFGLVALFSRKLQRPSAALRYLADASYWVFLVHLPLVILLQLGVSRLSLPLVLKYFVVVGGALAGSLLTYEWVVRRTWVASWVGVRRRQEGAT